MSFKENDTVSLIHESGYYKVIQIKSSHLIVIEDEDGFQRTVGREKICLIHSTDYGFIPENSKDFVAKVQEREQVKKKPVAKRISRNWNGFPYIDLHIEELVEDHIKLPAEEILQIQMSRFRSFILKCRSYNEKKAYVIHGVGEGVLRSEVHLYLHRQPGISYDFASSEEFGENGATEVTFY